jgi:hypothetical protein
MKVPPTISNKVSRRKIDAEDEPPRGHYREAIKYVGTNQRFPKYS